MSWFLLALVSVVTVSIATLLERVLLKEDESDPVAYAIVFQFLLGAIVFGFTILLHRFTLPDFSPVTVARFLFSAMLWAGSTVFGFHAIKRLSAAEVTILNSSTAVVAGILSLVFLGEMWGIKIIFGTALVLCSIVVVQSGKMAFQSRRGIIFALLSALCAGIAVVNDAIILRNFEVFTYVALMSFLPGIVLLITFPKKIHVAKRLVFSPIMKGMGIFTFFYALQAVSYYLAYQNGAPISHLSPITKSSIILTVILSAIFLKERKQLLKKILASVIVTAGVLLLN